MSPRRKSSEDAVQESAARWPEGGARKDKAMNFGMADAIDGGTTPIKQNEQQGKMPFMQIVLRQLIRIPVV